MMYTKFNPYTRHFVPRFQIDRDGDIIVARDPASFIENYILNNVRTSHDEDEAIIRDIDNALADGRPFTAKALRMDLIGDLRSSRYTEKERSDFLRQLKDVEESHFYYFDPVDSEYKMTLPDDDFDEDLPF